MKVCIIPAATYPIPAVKGGAVEGLIEYLIDQNEIFARVEITVISSYDKNAKEISEKYKNTIIVYEKYGKWIDKLQEKKLFIYLNKIFMKFKGRPLLSKNYVKRSLKSISLDEYDLVIIEGGGDIYNYKYLMDVVDHNKLCVHMHADIPGDLAYKDMFSKYICVSNYVARTLTMNGIVNKSDVYVLPNCVDIELFSQCDDNSNKYLREKYKINDDDFIFIYWGRLMPEKGVLELIKAFKHFNDLHEKTKLLIVGNPKFGYQVETEYTKELKIELDDEKYVKSIIFTGFIPHDELWKTIKIADVAVVPSVWNDCAPLVLFEAFASSIATITTRVGGIGELANDTNSILIDWELEFETQLYNAMEKLYTNNALRIRLGKKAFEDVNRYSIENYYNNFVDIIKNITGKEM